MMLKLSVVVPAHNEEENIPMLLDRLVPALEGSPETADFELIFVNDNSKDGTGALIDGYAAKDPRIRAVHRTGSPGFGNAIKAGFKNASGSIIIPVMADLSDDPDDIKKLVRKIDEGYDIAYGSRFCKGGATYQYPWKKMIANRLFNNTVRLVFGIRHRDVTNAFKAYRREVLDAIGIDNIHANGFDLTVEIPLKAHILGFRSAEVPVSWHDRKKGEAKLKLSENGGRYGMRLLRMFVEGNMVSLRDIFAIVVKGSWVRLALATVLGLLILFAVFYYAGFSQVFTLLSNVSIGYVLVSCAMILITFIVRTWRWSVLLRASGYRVHPDTAFKCIMFGWFMNYILPARIGDVARAITIKTTEDTPMSIGLSTIVVERAMDMLTLSLTLMAALMLVSGNTELMEMAVISLAVSLALVVGLALIYLYDGFFIRLFQGRFETIKESIIVFKKGLTDLSGNPQAIILCLLLSMPVWLFEIASIFFAARAIGVDLPFSQSALAGIVAFIAQAIPTTPAGIGIQEGAIAGVLMLFNVDVSVGTSIALVDHFARGLVIYILGIVSAIHIGFESRRYFEGLKNKKAAEVEDEQAKLT
jgi:uncharacterized protein (TIRG00374 family)